MTKYLGDVPPEAYEAVLEPFSLPDEFRAMHTEEHDEPAHDNSTLVASGTAYLTDDGAHDFVYAIHEDSTKPYEVTTAFMEGYTKAIKPFHNSTDITRRNVPGAAQAFERQKVAIDRMVSDAGLRTLASYALIKSSGQPSFSECIFIPRVVAEELPLRNREVILRMAQSPLALVLSKMIIEGTIGTSKGFDNIVANIKTNTDQASQILMFSLLNMARVSRIGSYIDLNPKVLGFGSMTRKEKRAVLRAESKQVDKR
jgi:hypothetical protein